MSDDGKVYATGRRSVKHSPDMRSNKQAINDLPVAGKPGEPGCVIGTRVSFSGSF